MTDDTEHYGLDGIHIEPVVKDRDGNVIDGNNRLEEDEFWPVYINEEVDTPRKLAAARLVANTNRRVVTSREISTRLEEYYEETKKETGEYPKAEEVAEALSHSVTWVYKYLPMKYKDKGMSELGKEGGDESGASRREATQMRSFSAADLKILQKRQIRPVVRKDGSVLWYSGNMSMSESDIQKDPDYQRAIREIESKSLKELPRKEPAKKLKDEPKQEVYDPDPRGDGAEDFALPPPIEGPVGTAHDDTTPDIKEIRKSVADALVALEEASPISEEPVKPTPYAKGLSPVKGSRTEKAFTKPAMKLKGHLHDAGLKDFIGEKEFAREGELNRDGKQKYYQADLYSAIFGVVLEPEGKGSKSHDNPDRDAFFKAKGLRVVHIPNLLIEDYGAELAEIIADFLVPMPTKEAV